jgi:hypothetical protein
VEQKGQDMSTIADILRANPARYKDEWGEWHPEQAAEVKQEA